MVGSAPLQHLPRRRLPGSPPRPPAPPPAQAASSRHLLYIGKLAGKSSDIVSRDSASQTAPRRACRMHAVVNDGGPHSAAVAASSAAPRLSPSCRRAPARLAYSRCLPLGTPSSSAYTIRIKDDRVCPSHYDAFRAFAHPVPERSQRHSVSTAALMGFAAQHPVRLKATPQRIAHSPLQ